MVERHGDAVGSQAGKARGENRPAVRGGARQWRGVASDDACGPAVFCGSVVSPAGECGLGLKWVNGNINHWVL